MYLVGEGKDREIDGYERILGYGLKGVMKGNRGHHEREETV